MGKFTTFASGNFNLTFYLQGCWPIFMAASIFAAFATFSFTISSSFTWLCDVINRFRVQTWQKVFGRCRDSEQRKIYTADPHVTHIVRLKNYISAAKMSHNFFSFRAPHDGHSLCFTRDIFCFIW